jgi:DMSO reductase anchor subunit/ferredoxin
MACNHCEDPVCLKGCPTLAYTKYLEYGAVIQDSDICFGCGYCTWVCPYNAPILDPVKGEVQKCNMCIDRLEEELKPACVSACLSNALEFGAIESIPAGRQQAKRTLPGFPNPEITRPNIRFEQTRSLPITFARPDNEPLIYERTGQGGCGKEDFRVKPLDRNDPKEWGLSHLRSREDSLVLFTLLSQGVVGGLILLFLMTKLFSASLSPLLVRATLFGLFGLQTTGMVFSTFHLGKPRFFYRAINNLRHSWVSREIATMGAFHALLGGYALVSAFPGLLSPLPDFASPLLTDLLGGGAAGMGMLGLFCMIRCYRIPARPFWDHWHTAGAFTASALILGSLGIGLLFGPTTFPLLAQVFVTGLLLQGVSLLAHARYLNRRGEEAAVSRQITLTQFGKSYTARFGTLGVLMVVALFFALQPVLAGGGGHAQGAHLLWGGLFLLALVHEVVGRALFYVAVVPTTIPGAFFWGNKSFQAHARKSGLADLPQVGVAPEKH